jgi:hypothetical protein
MVLFLFAYLFLLFISHHAIFTVGIRVLFNVGIRISFLFKFIPPFWIFVLLNKMLFSFSEYFSFSTNICLPSVCICSCSVCISSCSTSICYTLVQICAGSVNICFTSVDICSPTLNTRCQLLIFSSTCICHIEKI